MLKCAVCGKVIANVDPNTTRYGKCSACPRTKKNIALVKKARAKGTTKKIDKCWNCGKYEITRKDYRKDECGVVNKILSCEYCICLDDVSHYRVRVEKLDPKEILGE
jgi:hypothetical protein